MPGQTLCNVQPSRKELFCHFWDGFFFLNILLFEKRFSFLGLGQDREEEEELPSKQQSSAQLQLQQEDISISLPKGNNLVFVRGVYG